MFYQYTSQRVLSASKILYFEASQMSGDVIHECDTVSDVTVATCQCFTVTLVDQKYITKGVHLHPLNPPLGWKS